MKRAAAALFALLVAALPARAQLPPAGGVVIGASISGVCTSGYNLYNNSGVVGCQANGGGGTTYTAAANGGLSLSGTAFSLGDGVGISYTSPGQLTLGTAGSAAGKVIFDNATSGALTLQPTTGALGSSTITFPAVTGTATVLGNTVTGSGGTLVEATSPALVTPSLGVATGTSLALGAGSAITSTGAGGALGAAAFLGVGTGLSSSGGNIILGDAAIAYASGQLTLGTAGSVVGNDCLANATSGTVCLRATTGALGSAVATFQANTGIVAETNIGQSWTGNQDFAAGSASAPLLTIGNSTTGLYSVSTTGFGVAINGVSKLDYGITSSGNFDLSASTGFLINGVQVLYASGAITYLQNGSFTSNNGIGFASSALVVNTGVSIGWGTPSGGTNDTAISRISAGITGVGTGAQGSVAGTIVADVHALGVPHTVAGLPTPSTPGFDYVTDQLTTCAVAGAALTGGGSVKCPVFYNGTTWVGM